MRRGWMPILWVVLGAVLWAGCGSRGLQRMELTSSGRARSAWISVPARWGGHAMPLVIGLHGASGKRGRGLARDFIDHLGDEVVFAFPDALLGGPTATWVGPRDPKQSQGTDLIFLRDLIDAVARHAHVDRAQVYLAGFGEGGDLVWFASCFDAGTYAGFGVVGMPADPAVQLACRPSVKRPMALMHGKDDQAFPMGPPRTGPFDLGARWLIDNRRCSQMPTSTPTVTGSEAHVAQGEVHGCRTCALVEVWRVQGAAHCWPRRDHCSGVDALGLLLDYWRRAAGFPGTGPEER